MTAPLTSTKISTWAEVPEKLRLFAAVCGPEDSVRWTMSREQARIVALLIDAANDMVRREQRAKVRGGAWEDALERAIATLERAQAAMKRAVILTAIGLTALLAALLVVAL